MKLIPVLLLVGFISLSGCASNNPNAVHSDQASYASESYSPATTNNSYMFRSPPPNAAAALHAR